MTDIPPVNSTSRITGTSAVDRLRQAHAEGPPPQDLGPVDRVEISETAQALSLADPGAGIRAEKVAEIRQAIADGTYLTEDKIAIAADRLLEVLRATPV
jgi:anti-sigma28 factor (negative regulator of flagellin synthesis)